MTQRGRPVDSLYQLVTILSGNHRVPNTFLIRCFISHDLSNLILYPSTHRSSREMAKAQKPSRQTPQKADKSPWRSKGEFCSTFRADRKGKAKAMTTVIDVYEDLPQKVRRGATRLDMGPHKRSRQSWSAGAEDEEDAGKEAIKQLHARLLGGNGDGDEGAALESGDDEEIESDDVFEESDEEAFAGSAFARKVGDVFFISFFFFFWLLLGGRNHLRLGF